MAFRKALYRGRGRCEHSIRDSRAPAWPISRRPAPPQPGLADGGLLGRRPLGVVSGGCLTGRLARLGPLALPVVACRGAAHLVWTPRCGPLGGRRALGRGADGFRHPVRPVGPRHNPRFVPIRILRESGRRQGDPVSALPVRSAVPHPFFLAPSQLLNERWGLMPVNTRPLRGCRAWCAQIFTNNAHTMSPGYRALGRGRVRYWGTANHARVGSTARGRASEWPV
jgi:hypothetical protein